MKLAHLAIAFPAALVLPISACSSHLFLEGWDQQVMSAVLSQICEQKEKGYTFLSDSTSAVVPAFVPNDIDQSARASLIERNASIIKLPVAPHCDGLRSIEQRELDQRFAASEIHNAWFDFYQQFPEAAGVMSISLPGYSEDGGLAVIQVAGSCGATCGGGSFWLLRRIAGKWQLTAAGVRNGWTS